jgi:peptide deformylase
MDKIKVTKYPDPFLRKSAEEVATIDESVTSLIKSMFEVMEEEGGIGLAAPQIGKSKRIIVVSIDEKNFDKLALINPVIRHLSTETDVMEEGCLSIPGVNAEVERPVQAVVQGMTKSGRIIEISAEGLLARVLQHEIDHLDGVLFIDKLSSKERKSVAGELEDLEREYAAPIR